MSARLPASATVGASVERIRRTAGLTQGDVAKRVHMSAATISRIENGETGTSLADIDAILRGINTEAAQEFQTFLTDQWRHLKRPSFHHPDRAHLWRADQLLKDTHQLKIGALAAFEKQVVVYETEIESAARFLMVQSHDIAFVGKIGVGKTTAICSLADLRLRDEEVFLQQMVLEAGGGGTTLCEVQVVQGPQYGLLVEPRLDTDVYQDVADFAEYLTMRPEAKVRDSDAAVGISRELERAIRNTADLAVVTRRDADGKRHRQDPAQELAASVSHSSDLTIAILARMNLPRRNQRTVWYSPMDNDNPLKWLQATYGDINNGRHSDFAIPSRIQVVLPHSVLNHERLQLQITDTKGIDQTSEREDIERHFDNPRTLVVLCSEFKSAPEPTVQALLQRARDVGVPEAGERTMILVLVQPNEAVSMKDHAGNLVIDDEEGYDIKRDQVEAALVHLGLTGIPVGFFNAMSDKPRPTRDQILGLVDHIRKRAADRIDRLFEVVRRLELNREKAEAQSVLDSAMRRVAIWVSGGADLGDISDELHRQLLAAIRSAHARSVWASTRRGGAWYSLNFFYQIGRGARMVATKHVQRRVNELESVVRNLLEDEQFSHAHDFLEEVLVYVKREVSSLLQAVELTSVNEFRRRLGADVDFWKRCERRWGEGPGYRDDIAAFSEEWFNNNAARGTRREVIRVMSAAWGKIVHRVRELIADVSTTGVAGPDDSVARP